LITVAAGRPLLDLISIAYEADQPVLLHGRHGIGKSELLARAAELLRVELIVRDLSLLEPPDLIGIPQVGDDGRTHYAAPAFLPAGGGGLLVFEELNRCPRYMQAPCLQLLTARELGDYRLPRRWLPVGAVNDAADGYMADELDPALLSRFLNVQVVPDVSEWLTWARAGGVHDKVTAFVEDSPGVFNDPAANPRAWTYAGRILSVWERGERSTDLLAASLAGLLGEKWALAFLRTYNLDHRPLRPQEIIDHYPAHRAAIRNWVFEGRLDAVAATLELLKKHIQPQVVYESVIRSTSSKSNVADFLSDLSADLRRQARAWLKERGFDGLAAAKSTRGKR
jgi:hypothetical protein